MVEKENFSLATKFFEQAFEMYLNGNIENAIKEYKASIEIFPTAKAYVHLGLAYSLQGKYDEAIEECKKAIQLDPNRGNPYNDIGYYLMNLDREAEAEAWLEKAIETNDQNTSYLSYYRLGKIYEKNGKWLEALRYFNKAILINNEYEPAQNAIIKLSTLLN
jgi:tetratricopeptide (TPR) repeat protein